jgi:uncharacterized repeat protein (TIGR01451 family)/flagellin-like protein
MRRNTSVGLSPLVAVILLIAITVAAAVVVSGVFFNLAGIAGRRPTAVIDQVRLLAATGVGGGGTLVVVLKNTGDVPITGNPSITYTLPSGISCTTPSNPFTPTWGGNRNPGGTIAVSQSFSGAACTLLGRNMTLAITVTFADNSQQILGTVATGSIA